MTRLLHDPAEAAALLRAGELVAFATETVYGLGADARNGRAVAGIFEAKGRPHFNPLICHFPDIEAAFAEVRADERARRLAERFWPGPLTLVLPRRADSRVELLAGAGLDTLAVRVPAHPQALALLRAAATPIAAPSANRSGRVSPTTSAHVLEELSGRIAAVLEGGACEVGVESTVLDLSGGGAVLLRPGGVPREAIEAEIGPVGLPLAAGAAPAPTLRSPGLLLSHYAPTLPV
ncbi:MAG: threonylcarbamoyl-AMP synthase, partial [Acetobacteraceae bacterium]|nr:threonylcarbamoyl-AMP synthase [Acetobacteraceae bacterium]